MSSNADSAAVAPEAALPSARIIHISFVELATQLAYRKLLVGKVLAASLLIGLILCFVLPVRYTALTELLTPQQTPSTALLLANPAAVGGGGGALAAIAGSGLGLKNPNDIYIGMLESRPVADALIHSFSLCAVYHAKDMTAARKELAGRTSIQSQKDGFIAISVTDRDKNRAAAIANAYTQQLRLLAKSIAFTEAAQRRLFYEEQLSDARSALVSAEAAFQQVQQKKGMVQPNAQAMAIIQGLAMLHAQISSKEVELKALRSYSTDQNPEVRLAEQELTSLRQQATDMEQRSRVAGSGDLGLLDVPGAGMDYLRAEHEVQYRQAIYDLLMKQYDAARLDEAKEAAVIQVVEQAIPPERKSSPQYSIILSLSAFVGLTFGCLAALFSWWKQLLQADPIRAEQLRELNLALFGRTADNHDA